MGVTWNIHKHDSSVRRLGQEFPQPTWLPGCGFRLKDEEPRRRLILQVVPSMCRVVIHLQILANFGCTVWTLAAWESARAQPRIDYSLHDLSSISVFQKLANSVAGKVVYLLHRTHGSSISMDIPSQPWI